MAERDTSGQVAGRPDTREMTRARRDPQQLAAGLERWLQARITGGAAAVVSGVGGTSANGMSSETVLFDACWSTPAGTRSQPMVVRMAPDESDVWVFPSYDMARQYEAIRLVGELTSVPVPAVHGFEPDPAVLGAPFFVMDRVEGVVPPDVAPYNFGDSWLYDAAPADRRRLQDATVGVLAELHGIERAEEVFRFLEFDAPGDGALRRHVAHTRAWYEFAAADGMRSPVVERGFAWLEDNWPADTGPPVLSWGDARIGNVMYRDFEPVAVLDWEMAGLGPRELDLAWLIFAHRVFEDLADRWGLPGMPDFLRMEDVAATYESLTGHTPRHLEFYAGYAAVQWGIVFLRTGRRQISFGELEPPADVDDLLHHRDTLERILAGTYWT